VQPDSPHCFCTSPAKQCGFSICLSTPTYRHRNRRRVDIAYRRWRRP